MSGALDYPVPTQGTDMIRELVKRVGRVERRPAGTARASVTNDGEQVLVPTPQPRVIPTAPPASAPVLEAVGSASAITVVAHGAIAPSTILDYYLNGELVYSGRQSVLTWGTEPDGDPLVDGIDYSWQVAARNDIGQVMSDTVTARLNQGVSTETVLSWVSAGFILAGMIDVGSNMELDPDTGLVITQPDGRKTILSSVGLGNQFVGQGTFETLLVTLSYVLAGTGVLSGPLALGAGVPDPGQQLSATNVWDQLAFASPGTRRRGLKSGSTSWLTTDYVSGTARIQVWDKTSGTALADVGAGSPLGSSSFDPLGGVTFLNPYYWLLGQDYNEGGHWRLTAYNNFGFPVGPSAQVTAANNDRLALGDDGTDLLVVKRAASGNLYISTVDHTNLTELTVVACGFSSAWSTLIPTGVVKSTVDTATVRYAVSFSNGTIMVFSTAGIRVPAEEWPIGGGNTTCYGIQKDASGEWHTFNGYSTVTHYTDLVGGSSDWTYTWQNTRSGGFGGQSLAAPTLTKTLAKRANWVISLPSHPPDDATVNGADTATIYAAWHGNPYVKQLTLADGVYSATLNSLATTPPGAPPLVSGFASIGGATGAVVSPYSLDAQGARIVNIPGIGAGRLGPLAWKADGTRAFDPVEVTGGNGTGTTGAAQFRFPTGMAETTFVAPQSGRVAIIAKAYAKAGTAGTLVLFAPEARAGATIRSGTVVKAADGNDSFGTSNNQTVRGTATSLVTGLTPGATYNAYIGIYSSEAAATVTNTKIVVEER